MAGFLSFRPYEISPWPSNTPTGRGKIEPNALAAVIEREFAWLTDLGFVAAGCEHSTLFPESRSPTPTIACPYTRPDAVIVVVAWDHPPAWPLAVLIGPPAESATAEDIERDWSARPRLVARFGAFPVFANDIEGLVHRASMMFRDAASAILRERPVATDHLQRSLDGVITRFSNDVRASALQRVVTGHWSAGRRFATARSLNELASITELESEHRGMIDEIRVANASVGDPHERWRTLMQTVRRYDRLASLAWAYREHNQPTPDAVTAAEQEVDRAMAVMETDLGEIERGLLQLDDHWIDPALTFIEVDPYFFGSGYRKSKLMRRLARMALSRDQRARVSALLLRAVDAGTTGNNSDGWRLARRHSTNELRRELRARLYSADPLVARRALAMIARVRRPNLSEADRAKIVELIAIVGKTSRHGGPTWLSPLRRRFGA